MSCNNLTNVISSEIGYNVRRGSDPSQSGVESPVCVSACAYLLSSPPSNHSTMQYWHCHVTSHPSKLDVTPALARLHSLQQLVYCGTV